MRFPSSIAILLAALTVSLDAAEPAISTTMTAQRRIMETLPDGSTLVRLETSSRVLPGDEIVYTITCENRGREPATNVIVTSPVPANTTCRPESAEGEQVNVLFSVDQGRTFDLLEALVVATPEGQVRPARTTDLTHVRWVRTTPLPAGYTTAVRFIAVVN